MIKSGMAVLLFAALFAAPAAGAEEPGPDAHSAIQWIGKHRDEVIKLLGEPVKVKKKGKGEILIFHGPLEWFAEPAAPPDSGEIVIKGKKEKPIRISVGATPAAASPADVHEIILDSEGNPVGAYGRVLTAPGTGVVTVHQLKLFLDENGYVYKTKIGKRVTR